MTYEELLASLVSMQSESRPLLFMITSYDDDSNPHTMGFIVDAEGVERATLSIEQGSDIEDKINIFVENGAADIELDYGTLEYWGDYSDSLILMAYHSSEIIHEMFDECMTAWRNLFVESCSEDNVSKVVDMLDTDFLSLSPIEKYDLFMSRIS